MKAVEMTVITVEMMLSWLMMLGSNGDGIGEVFDADNGGDADHVHNG